MALMEMEQSFFSEDEPPGFFSRGNCGSPPSFENIASDPLEILQVPSLSFDLMNSGLPFNV